MSLTGPNPPREDYRQSTAALPGTSNVDFLGDLKRVIDLNARIRAICYRSPH
jgi:hypothetical protein